jgi:sigma-B regulation protein RsbU (phosphoserine phosphatase)
MLELKDKLLARDELEAGRKVQIALTPEQSPLIGGWSVWLFTRTANEVGGDLVDLQKLESGNYRISIADVAGKGLRAALIATKLQATIRACSDSFALLGELGKRLNRVFYRDSLRNFFASLVCIEITPAEGTLKFMNAGHLPPLIIRGQGIEETAKGGPALGIVADVECEERTVELGTGEMFIAYSDGLTEAKNIDGDFFGQQRLIDFLLRLGNLDARAVGTALVAEVDRFSGGAQAYDDLSLVVLKRTP